MVYEQALFKQGHQRIAGVDEAGRGPVAGPVLAAAVILPQTLDAHLKGSIKDSKTLSESLREQLYPHIIQQALAYGVAQATAKEIDTLNIRRAALLAMQRAVNKLSISPDYVLVDGRDYPQIDFPGEALVKGDQKSLAVGAASILAKVVRDRILTSMHNVDPRYGFAYHKGYPTQYHRIAVQLFGPSKAHRLSFSGVKEHVLRSDLNQRFHNLFLHLTRCKTPECVETFQHTLNTALLSKEERFYLEQSARHRLEALQNKQRLPTTLQRGKWWERCASNLLQSKGYTVWEHNFKTREGEIDLICNKGSLIVFVEVKGRRANTFGDPLEAVTAKKRQRILKTAQTYLYQRDLLQGWDIRYDIVAVQTHSNNRTSAQHIEDAFRMEETFD